MLMQPIAIFGIKLIESRYLCDRKQVRFPRSKKVRIRRKWAKQSKNYRDFPKPDIYQIGPDTYVGHPATIAALRTAAAALRKE